MAAAARSKTITKKQLQRIIGLANHLAKVVHAARIFIGRILAALREADGDTITVSHHVKADLKWFARQWTELVKQAGLTPASYFLHSLRRGAAEFTYNKAKADLNDVMTQGTWRSLAVRAYIKKKRWTEELGS